MQGENLRGALLMMGSMLVFTISDACVKAIGGAVPIYQLLALRGSLASVLILLVAWRMGGLRLDFPRRDWHLLALRSLAEIGETWLFLTALMHMKLANITALLQLVPLALALAGYLFFGERLGWRRIVAIGLGFLGMLLIVKPGTEGFNLYTLYALGAMLLVTARDLATRRLSRQVPSVFVTVTALVSVTLFGFVFGLGVEWQPVSAQVGLLMAASGVLLIGGFGLVVAAMRTGEIAAVVPFRYTGLLWALVLGWAVFGEWPTPLTLLGAAVIAGTGLFTLWRERVTTRRP